MPDNEKRIDASIAVRHARQRLDSLKRSGLELLPKPTGRHPFHFQTTAAEILPSAPVTSSAIQSPAANVLKRPSVEAQAPSKTDGLFPGATTVKYESAPLEQAERMTQLQIIQAEVAQCTRCTELVANRTQTVFGVGNVSARLCFVGEGPGADEDRLGEPFVGAAGQLLDKIITASKLNRQDVYILNTVKCRPPGNRNPNETELANCWEYAERQLEIIQPEFICCLGSVAARTLLKTTESIGRLRGQFFHYRGSRVVVTYHPAYLLRNPSAKRQVWDDMKMLLREMGISV